MTTPNNVEIKLEPNHPTNGTWCELCDTRDQEEPAEDVMILRYKRITQSGSGLGGTLSLCEEHRVAIANAILSDHHEERGIIPVQVVLLISHLVQIGYDVTITSVTKGDVLFSIGCFNPPLVAQTLGYHGVRLGVKIDVYADFDRVFGAFYVRGE